MENQELNVNQPAQPVQAAKENREDKKSKKGLFVILFLLLIIILFAVYYFFLRKPDSTSDTNTTKNTTNTATENTIVCDVDNQKSVTFKMTNVNSMKSGSTGITTIALMANKANEDYSKVYTLQVLIPGTTTMDFTQKPTDYNVGLHYGSSAEDSYQTDMDNGDTFHIKITKFEGNHIVGQFSGELTRITSNGWDTTKKVNLKNCVIDSTKEIKPL